MWAMQQIMFKGLDRRLAEFLLAEAERTDSDTIHMTHEQIAALFLKTADNEKEHAKLWFKELNGIGDTSENLLSGASAMRWATTISSSWTGWDRSLRKPASTVCGVSTSATFSG